jgi:hypothetical protein
MSDYAARPMISITPLTPADAIAFAGLALIFIYFDLRLMPTLFSSPAFMPD